MLPEFKNEPLTDYSKPENRSAMEAALAKVKSEFGREHPLVIGGNHITGLETFDSTNPAHKDEVLGRFQKGTRDHVEQADAALSLLPPSTARECFSALTDFVVQRDR